MNPRPASNRNRSPPASTSVLIPALPGCTRGPLAVPSNVTRMPFGGTPLLTWLEAGARAITQRQRRRRTRNGVLRDTAITPGDRHRVAHGITLKDHRSIVSDD